MILAEDITIAITVFTRREYVLGAIRSALEQTIPVKVMVVEDCSPDTGMQAFITNEFGDQIRYIRNPSNRGLFDNWNACMEYCTTPWLSILHDDDLLLPCFVEKMIVASNRAPGRALYFGRLKNIFPSGETKDPAEVDWGNWRDLGSGRGLEEFLQQSIVGYAGHLMRVEAARSLGGFRKNSLYTGDWDLGFRLSLVYGAVEISEVVGVGRGQEDGDRATTRIVRNGWKWVLDNVQRKRNLALLRKTRGEERAFERSLLLAGNPIPLQQLAAVAPGFSRRTLRYNWWLFIQSKPPHWRYRILQLILRLTGPEGLLWLPKRAVKNKPRDSKWPTAG